MKNFIVCAAALACSQALSLAVVTSPVEAFNNATVQPTGPRAPDAGKNFYNIEGSANGNFASYGVMDFTLVSEAIPGGEMLSSLNSISISLTQSNAGFTNSGGMAFYLTTDTTTSINTGSPLTYNSSAGEEGLGTQLSQSYLLGTDVFTEVANGTVDTYTFDLTTLDPAAASFLSNLLQTGGTLRIIMTPTDATTAATYAGFSNNTFSGPTVSIDYSTAPVPEPSAIALGGLGLAMVLSRARQRRAVLV